MTPRKPRRTAQRVSAPKAVQVPIIAPKPPEVATETIPTDWELAFLALYAEDAFCMSGGGVLPDPRLSPKWTIIGTVTAVDAPLRIGKHKIGAKRVFYGWLLRSQGGRRVLAIRGTQRCAEWLIDGLFAPRAAHPVAGKVESGFWSVYDSMRVNGEPVTSIAKDGPITVVGHSLGAALATYASLELAQAGAKVRGVFVASPHPGDVAFSKAFGAIVPDHVMYRNPNDLVPKLPFWFGYSAVPNVKELRRDDIMITGGIGGQHHVISYSALIDRLSLKAFKPLPCDRKFLDCVLVR